MRTFRKNIAQMLLVLFVLIVLAVLPARADSILSIQPSLSTPNVGSVFDVFVNISNASDLYAFQFDISFDPTILSAMSVTEGSLFPGSGITTETIDNTSGSISFIADVLTGAPSGVSGDGTLADLTFQAVSEGTSPIALSNMILLDFDLSDIPFSKTDGTVSPTSSVPEPTALLLLLPVLLGLLRFGRKLTH